MYSQMNFRSFQAALQNGHRVPLAGTKASIKDSVFRGNSLMLKLKATP
jgi:hypothetical protein